MKQGNILKYALVSGAVLSSLLITGAVQAQATTGQEATNSDASSSSLTGSTSVTSGKNVTLQSSSVSNESNVYTSGENSDQNTDSTGHTTGDTNADSMSTESSAPESEQNNESATKESNTDSSENSSVTDTASNSNADSTDTTPTEVVTTSSAEQVGQAAQPATLSANTMSRMSVFKEAKANIAATVVTAKLDLSAEKATIQAGETATFNLKLSVSGINQTMNEQRLVIDLPVGFKLTDDQDLTIDGVTPTLSTDGTQLTYAFMTPINGLSVSRRFTFDTGNQPIMNGTTIEMASQYFDGETALQITGKQIITISSKASYGVTNQMIGTLAHDANGNIVTDENGNATINSSMVTGAAGDLLVYRVGISSPKATLGQAYLEPGSLITLKYMIPTGMKFVSVDSSTIKPTIQNSTDGRTLLTFTMQAPSIEEQKAATGNLFSQYFNIVLRINADVPINTSLTTMAQVNAQSVNDEEFQSPVAPSQITSTYNLANDITEVHGSVWYFYNRGPADGNGNITNSSVNTDPKVTSDADLAFQIMIGPGDFYFPDYGYAAGAPIQKEIVTYDLDNHLNLNTMSIPPAKAYLMNGFFAVKEKPIFDVYVKYQDSDSFELIPGLTQITDTNGQAIDMTKLVDNKRSVDQIQFVWTTFQPGQLYSPIIFHTSPKAGYYGTVSNSLFVEMAGNAITNNWWDIKYSDQGAIMQYPIWEYTTKGLEGLDLHQWKDGNAASYNQFMRPQTAEIIKPSENTPRVLNESISFSNQKNGLVITGDNILQVMVENNQASVQSITGLKTYVILPKNVSYTGNDANVSATKLIDGSTKLTINWATVDLAPNQQNRVNLNVNIDPNIKVTTLTPILYSTVNEKDTVVPSTLEGTTQSDVKLIPDTSDIDGNPDTTTLFMVNKSYVLDFNLHQIHVSATATNALNQTGSEVTAQAGQEAQFGLDFTNNSDTGLTDVTIIGTLPVADDTSITNPDDARGTTAAVTMSGPIILPASWASLATVTYSLKSDPTAYVDASAVTDFSQVVGFKITTNGDDYLPAGDASQLVVPVKIAKNALLNQAAYISYQVSANGLTATEGTKGGLLIDLGPDGQPGSGIWVRTKTVTRTIDYRDAETNAVIAPSVTQTATVKQNITKDPATGELVYGNWTLTNGGWTAVKSPDLSANGYDTASGNTDAVTIGDDTTNTTVTVTYAHQIKTTTEAKTVTRTINYLDKDTNAVLADAKTQQVVFTRTNTEDMVNHAKTNGAWTPASGQFDVQISPDLSAKGYQAPDQASVAALTVTPAGQNSVVNVYYEKQTVTPTDPTGPSEPTTPVTPTTPAEPVTPTTPVEPTTPDKPDNDTTTDKQENKVPASKPTQTKTGTTQTGKVDANGTVKSEANQLTLTKPNESETAAKKLPQTDEQSSAAGLLGVMLATMLGLVGLGRKKRDEE